MMTGATGELNCYNRGCGQTFNPSDNDKDVCCHHPGLPVFHDAYKGWSCCNKKCTDFTEFLNIKGCTFSKHTNVKPPEPPKPQVDKATANDPVEVKPKIFSQPSLPRTPFDSDLTLLVPNVAEALKNKFQECPNKLVTHAIYDEDCIILGTCCKNGGCRGTYEGADSDSAVCTFHSGVPIFHEGMKYWSCCQKKTSDFNTFLNQVGCTTGHHKWKKETVSTNTMKCRWDWHQTATHVVVAVYAKEYHPTKSFVKLHPTRLCLQLLFPNESSAIFDLDLELRGVIDVKESSAHMLGTKVEVKLRKAEPGSWTKIDFPRLEQPKEEPKESEKVEQHVWQGSADDDCIDLSVVEPIPQMGGINISEVIE